MQTILGATGIIGTGLAQHLTTFTDRIRLVSRNPRQVNTTDELCAADLRYADQVAQAVAGSEVVYLTAGLKYDARVWQQQWPLIMRNVIDACKRHDAKLVFFDNVYALGKVEGWMTEDSPMNAVSKKGKVRKQIAGMILDETAKGNLQAIIARAPDFYGPSTPFSFFNVLVADNLVKGKKAQWLINEHVKHSLIYTPDASKATAMLGNKENAFNQVWHLPTDRNARIGKELIEMFAAAFGVKPGYTILNKLTLQIIGLFIPPIGESVELLYQNDSDYLFDSSKFEQAFQFKPTPTEMAVEAIVKAYRDKVG